MSPDARPDRHALLELQALLTQITTLRSEGDAAVLDCTRRLDTAGQVLHLRIGIDG